MRSSLCRDSEIESWGMYSVLVVARFVLHLHTVTKSELHEEHNHIGLITCFKYAKPCLHALAVPFLLFDSFQCSARLLSGSVACVSILSAARVWHLSFFLNSLKMHVSLTLEISVAETAQCSFSFLRNIAQFDP